MMNWIPELILAAGGTLFVAVFVGLFIGGQRHPKWSKAAKLKLLQTVPFLANLPKEQLEQVAGIVRELRIPPNVYIIREHRVGEAMYIMVKGNIHILKQRTSDKTLLQTVGPGELIGEMALITGARRIASARSITSCLLLQIDRDDFHDLLALQPDVMAAVWNVCEAHSIDLALREDAHLRRLDSESRLAWIAARESIFTKARERIPTKSASYLAVVAGVVDINGTPHSAPQLVPIKGQEIIEVLEPGRICWLPISNETNAAA